MYKTFTLEVRKLFSERSFIFQDIGCLGLCNFKFFDNHSPTHFLFLASSKILTVSSNARHHLCFPDSCFFKFIEAMLMSSSVPPSMINAKIDSKHSIKKIRLRIDSILNKRTINLKHLVV